MTSDKEQTMRSDKELLAAGYKNAFTTIKGKYVDREYYSDRRNEIISRIDKITAMPEDACYTEVEKAYILRAGKEIYAKYCSFARGNERGVTDQLRERADKLIDYLAEFESQILRRIRLGMDQNTMLNLEGVLADKRYRKKLLQTDIASLLDIAEKERRISVYVAMTQYFTTPHGKRYHIESCPHCKGKAVSQGYEEELKEAGYLPCRCIEPDREKRQRIRAKTEGEKARRYMTVYIDESRRKNPGRYFDETADRMQNVFSLIICRGQVDDESMITGENTLSEHMFIAGKSGRTSDITLEALGEAMIRAAFSHRFKGHLTIYTDNESIAETWKEDRKLKYIAGLFREVEVLYVSRDSNKKADSILRKNVIMQLPRAVMEKVITLHEKMGKDLN